MNKFIKILLAIMAIAVAGVVLAFAPSFIKGVGDGYNQAHKQHNKDSEKPNETLAEVYSPAIWKVEHGQKVSYLFGSIHLGDDSMYPLPQHIMDAYQTTDYLAVEADIENIDQMQLAKLMQELAPNSGTPLEQMLSEKTVDRYKNYCQEEKLACQNFQYFDPWYVSFNFMARELAKSGLDTEAGIDKYFLKLAKNNKPILSLESLELQMRMFESFSIELQDALLLGAMDLNKESDNSADADIIRAWKTGNVEQFVDSYLESQAGEGFSEDTYQEFLDKALVVRNKNMADKLDTLFKEGKSIFSVVGAAHYAGDDGIHNLLKNKGYTVTRLKEK